MRTFTLQQARAILPVLKAELKKLQPAYFGLKDRWSSLAKLHNLPAEDPKLNVICEQDEEIQLLTDRIQRSFSKFERLGVECKGIEQGLFDFPCLFNDQVAYLCWQLGEDDIYHWHEIDTGFRGRKPLLDPIEEVTEATTSVFH